MNGVKITFLIVYPYRKIIMQKKSAILSSYYARHNRQICNTNCTSFNYLSDNATLIYLSETSVHNIHDKVIGLTYNLQLVLHLLW